VNCSGEEPEESTEKHNLIVAVHNMGHQVRKEGDDGLNPTKYFESRPATVGLIEQK